MLDSETTLSDYHGYGVARRWGRDGLIVRRLVRRDGVVPIPRVLPGYRVALSLTDNNARLAVGGRVTTRGHFAPGTTVLGLPGDAFDGDMRDRVDVMLFLMTPAFVAATFERLDIPSADAALRDLPPRQDLGLLDAGSRLVRAMGDDLDGDELYCDLLVEAMVNRILCQHATVPAGRMPYRETLSPAKLRRLIDFICANLSGRLRLADLADVAGLSQAHLARGFRRATGMSLHRYVLQRRLERARDLLSRPGNSPRAVARRCGFADSAHLSKAYKKAFGTPPSRSRK